MLKTNKIIMFPITKEELEVLKNSRDQFETYFKMPFIASELHQEVFANLLNNLDMENDYWFMNTLWVVVDIKAREIYGTIRYEKCQEANKIIANLTMLSDFPEACDEALSLFAKFLTVNNYDNILIENDKIQL